MLQTVAFKNIDCPSNKTFIEYVKENSDWNSAVSSFDNIKFESKELMLDPVKNHKDILSDCIDLMNEVSPIRWQSRMVYPVYGLSLTYNPDTSEEFWKSLAFGNVRYRHMSHEDYYNGPTKDRPSAEKNDYLDSYGMRKVLPQVMSKPTLSSFLNSFSLPIIKSTLRVIDGNETTITTDQDGGMHTDDSVFECLRLNICLSNDGSFGIQYEGEDPYVPSPGDGYAVDTDRRHRVVSLKRSRLHRAHLVLGFAPWLDYNSEDDSWSFNEYYGKVHPLDMVKQRLIFKTGI